MSEEHKEENLVAMSLVPPSSAITDDGEWLVLAVSKIWTDRKGRRGALDPSGGLSLAQGFNFELLLALPLVDQPQSAPPKNTITLEVFQKRVINPLVLLNDSFLNPTATITSAALTRSDF